MIRIAFHSELSELIGDLARMGRLAGQLMINASAALLQADLALADLVIARSDEMDAQHHEVEQRCLTRLTPQVPAAADLQTVVAALHAAHDLQRMGDLAQHTAKLAQLTDLELAILPDDVRTVIAQMSLLASGLAHQAATAIEKADPLSGDRLARGGDEVDALRRQLFRIVFAENWSYGAGPAVHAALIGRYYECFADHAVAIARQVRQLATERMPKPLRR
ncbi:MAG: phosphate signaling complex PhoU family protein [Pseudonocardiaceae bacterium]